MELKIRDSLRLPPTVTGKLDAVYSFDTRKIVETVFMNYLKGFS